MKTIEKSRFDARISKEQKALFEQAARLGGFRNLTDYVIQVLMEKSADIIQEHEAILKSKRDSEIFFDAITRELEPNKALKSAASKYHKTLKKLNG